jgi:hypothetical protein
MQTTPKVIFLIATFALSHAASLPAMAGDEIKLSGTVALDSDYCTSGTSNPNCVLNFSITGKAAKILYDGMPAKGVLQECTGDVEKIDKSGMHCIKGKTADDFVCDFSYGFKNSKFGSGPDGC